VRMECEQLKKSKGDLEKEVRRLNDEVEKLTHKAEISKKASAKQSELIAEVKAELKKSKKSCSEWDKRKKEFDGQISGLKKEIEALRRSVGEQKELVSGLKGDLAKAKQEKGHLNEEIKRLKNRKVDVRKSDLFKELEQVNVTLREKIVQIESERQRLAKSVKKLEKREERYDSDMDHEKSLRHKLENELSDANDREKEYKELIERYMAQIPKLEATVTELSDKLSKEEKTLADREEELHALKIELEKREHRLVKAERVAEILEQSREAVLHASDKEKLDMYYNTALVYAREGKYRQAEQSYMQALHINPMDADVHYNLAILYDDDLKQPEKAELHYRRYLKLHPHGPDADQVRNWLMKLEMKNR